MRRVSEDCMVRQLPPQNTCAGSSTMPCKRLTRLWAATPKVWSSRGSSGRRAVCRGWEQGGHRVVVQGQTVFNAHDNNLRVPSKQPQHRLQIFNPAQTTRPGPVSALLLLLPAPSPGMRRFSVRMRPSHKDCGIQRLRKRNPAGGAGAGDSQQGGNARRGRAVLGHLSKTRASRQMSTSLEQSPP